MNTAELTALLNRLRAEPREAEWLDRPVEFYGTAYVRDGTSKTELSKYPEKVRALWNRRVDWSAQVRDHQPVSREDIDRLLLDKQPEVLSHDHKLSKIHNLISSLSGKAIRNVGTRGEPQWVLVEQSKQ